MAMVCYTKTSVTAETLKVNFRTVISQTRLDVGLYVHVALINSSACDLPILGLYNIVLAGKFTNSKFTVWDAMLEAVSKSINRIGQA